MTSPAQRLAALTEQQRVELFAGLDASTLAALPYVWPLWARPDQLAPPGEWRTWLMLGGRGSGKTRAAAEHVRGEVEAGRRRNIGVVAPTAEHLRRIVVEGVSGILACCPPSSRPTYEMTMGRITWPDGAMAHLFSGEEGAFERLRGPNLDLLWIDELAAMPAAEKVWDLAQMALRLPGPTGKPAACVITTTPRPIPVLRQIIADPGTVVTRSRTADNAANLDASTLAYLQRRYAGTSLGRQELDAELLLETEGALWTRALLDSTRVTAAPHLVRIVVACDPSGGSGSTNAETGIVVAGKDVRGHGYVLADGSFRATPERWARRCVDLFESHKADRIICERNFGGEMAEHTIRMVSPHTPLKMIQASRGKAVRAEPVVALYEQNRVHHVGSFPALEDQLTGWVPGMPGQPSPDRLDALVWALTELCVESRNNFEIWMRCINKWPPPGGEGV